MSTPFTITIDGRPVEVQPGESVLAAARKIGMEIPTLCYLEKCGPLNTCQVCLVKTNGKLVPSCGTKATPGMVIESETEEVHEARRTALELLFSDHVGDCLSPCHRLCPLQLNVPVMLRHVQAGRIHEAAMGVRQALALPAVLGRLCHHPCEQGCRRNSLDDPAAIRDMEKFVADWDLGFGEAKRESRSVLPHPDPLPLGEGRGEGKTDEPAKISSDTSARPPYVPPRKPASAKSVAIIGAGPAGLAAAHYLAREGHAVTVADRRPEGGGTLRTNTTEEQLPRAVLDAELAQLARLGIQFKSGVELGRDLSLEGLLRGFDAVLLTVGEIASREMPKLGVTLGPLGIEADPNTGRTSVTGVFAAGSAVKPVKQLVKAMTEGRAVAECVHLHLLGRAPRRPEKAFSSVMGRLDPGEVRDFLRHASNAGKVSPCDRCLGHNRSEAALESSRCLHCDCRSSGNCVFQHWAQVYGADANRFRSERKKFEQQTQPGGIIFEPGKCIVCGICVKLAEMAAEPLGLTFIGRGFDVRMAAPFDRSIEEGLQKVAAECVEHCPTGALVFKDRMPTQS
ncbi:MAG: FAD-dependent oxidoreductase [Verrucomicrobia bacterium]|nr:FAD-dependent oxidoreductase [Verrucomicrobiota bacterium]